MFFFLIKIKILNNTTSIVYIVNRLDYLFHFLMSLLYNIYGWIMREIKFNTLSELYNRLKPALYSKCLDIKRKNINYIKEEDIWNYLVNYIWINKINLDMFEMVQDIFDLDIIKLDNYVKGLLENRNMFVNKDNLL